MDLKRWPRKNDPDSIRARQEALGLSDGVTSIDLSPFVKAQEMLTGAAVIPVSVVGPLELRSQGSQQLGERGGVSGRLRCDRLLQRVDELAIRTTHSREEAAVRSEDGVGHSFVVTKLACELE